jgi:ribosomal protein L32
MGEKLRQVCGDITEARDRYNVCENCGKVYLKSRNTCPNCGYTKSKEVQPCDMDRELAT